MTDIPRLFQAFVGPAIFVSAEGLVLLSLNARLMGIVSRLRAYLYNRHSAAKRGRIDVFEAYAAQVASMERRAEMIRKAFLMTLYALAGTITTCLLLGLGLYWPYLQLAATIVFVTAMLSFLVGMIHYIREVRVALTSVREEVADLRFMDLGDRAEVLDEEGKQ